MKKKLKSILKNEDGSEVVELVLCVPLLMFVLSLIICYSQLFYAAQVALTAADIGTRKAIVESTQYDGQASAVSAATDYINQAGMGVTYVSSDLTCPTWKRGEVCSYSVTVKVNTAMPMAGPGGFGRSHELTKSGHMMVEKE